MHNYDAVADLTARETEVLVQIARGRSNAQIADEFVVSVNTVKTHIKRVLSKLGVHSRAEAVVVAYETGVVVPGRMAQPANMASRRMAMRMSPSRRHRPAAMDAVGVCRPAMMRTQSARPN